jgi:DNA-binding NarL/FixJ family response regulator
MDMKPIRLMFVDDQKLFIDGLTHILKKVDRTIRVISSAHNGREAIDVVEKSLPDVIVMDIRMPVMNGVDAVKIIHTRHPSIKIIMLTTYDDDEYVKDALTDGASGYLLKDIPIEDLVAQIKSVCYGNVAPLSQSVLEKLTHTIGEPESGEPPFWLDAMNKTERRILRLMVEGFDNREISAAVFLAEQTVRNYIHSIYDKIEARNRAQAIKVGRSFFRFLQDPPHPQ